MLAEFCVIRMAGLLWPLLLLSPVSVFRRVNKALVRWARHKYKRLHHHKTRTVQLLEKIAKRCPRLFA